MLRPKPGRAYSAFPDLLAKFKGPTSKGREEKKWDMGWWEGSKREGKRGDRGPQGLVHNPMSEILKNTLIAKLIWRGSNTDVCPGWQTPSRRQWLYELHFFYHQCKFLDVHTALYGVVEHWQLGAWSQNWGSIRGLLGGLKYHCLQCKRQFAISGQISEFHIFVPPNAPPLQTAARGACPPSFP